MCTTYDIFLLLYISHLIMICTQINVENCSLVFRALLLDVQSFTNKLICYIPIVYPLFVTCL